MKGISKSKVILITLLVLFVASAFGYWSFNIFIKIITK